MELSDSQRDFFKMLLLERNFLAAAPNHPEAAQMLDLYLGYILTLSPASLKKESMPGCYEPMMSKRQPLR